MVNRNSFPKIMLNVKVFLEKEINGLRANFLVDRLFKLLVVHYCSDLMIMMILFMMVVIMMMMGLP